MAGGINLERILLGGEDGRRDTPLTALAKIDRNFQEVAAALSGRAYARLYGAIGDGETDNTDAITRARRSGLVVVFGDGVYLTRPIEVTADLPLKLKGQSRASTTLKLMDGSDDHLISFGLGVTNCSIASMTLDQNSANQSAGHGIRLAGADGLVMEDFKVQNCFGYGIGIQAGTNKNIQIKNFEIDTTGDDAIDIKDLDEANENIIIDDGILKNFGATNASKPGIDVRGPAIVSNIIGVMENTNDRGLLRLRAAGAQGRHGQGVFSNLRGDGTSGTNCVALWTEDGVTNFAIDNVSMRGGALAVLSGTGGVLSNLTQLDGDGGQEAVTIFGTDMLLSNVAIDGCTRGIDFEAGATGNVVRGFRVANVSGSDAIRFNSTADNNTIESGSIQSGKTVSDSASGTTIRDVKNWKTAANLLSGTFAVDSTGSRTLTIAHGLAVTPAPEDVSLTIGIPPAGVTDWRPTLLQLDGNPNATNIFARVVVGTASATASAVARLSIKVRAKNS